MGAGLAWRDITILRAAAKFLRQAAFTFSVAYMQQALVKNPELAGLLVALFYARNDPGAEAGREARVADIEKRLETALKDVPSLDDDRIIRRFKNVLDAVLRTNFFQEAPDGSPSGMALNSIPPSWTNCRRRGPGARSSSMPRRWRACICALAASPAAASAGRTGARISAPRSWAWSRRSRSRMP